MDQTGISASDVGKLLQGVEAGVVVHAADTSIQYINRRALELLRLNEAQAYGKQAADPHWRFIDEHGDTLKLADYPVNKVLSCQCEINHMVIGILDSTAYAPTWVKINAYPELDEVGEVARVIVSFIDITLSRRSFSFENIVELCNDVVIVTDAYPLDEPGPRIVYVNQAFVDLTGYTPDEVIGKTPRILQGEETSSETTKRISQHLHNGLPVRETILNYGKSGAKYWLDVNIVPLYGHLGEIKHFVAIERDVTHFKNREFRLKAEANQDTLTGIMNRRGFSEMARITQSQAFEDQKSFSLIEADLDNFKQINDTYGHDAGDKILHHVSSLLQGLIRDGDIAGRLGGEEFAVLLPQTPLKAAVQIAERLRSLLETHPATLAGDEKVSVTASFGVAESDTSNPNYEITLKQADKALYRAKESGRNCVISYSLEDN